MKHLQTRVAILTAIISLASTYVAAATDPTAGSIKKNEQPDEVAEVDAIDVKLNKKWRFELSLDLETGAGYMKGAGTLKLSGPVWVSDVGVQPAFQLKTKLLRIGLALAYSDFEAIGFALDQRHFKVGSEIRFRPGKSVDCGWEADLGYLSKPDWPDLYQPIVFNSVRTGQFEQTDRYSYLHASTDLYFKYWFSRQYSAELYGGYYFQNNSDDPAYNEVDDPTHLVPGDQTRLRGGLQFTGVTPRRFWRFSLDARLDSTHYQKAFARDRKTGLTHAASTTQAPNPKQRFLEFRLRQRNSFKIVDDVLQLVVIAEYTHNSDVFDGYFTWNAYAADIDVDWTPNDRFLFELGYGVTYRKYTSRGYQQSVTPYHPSLDNGDRIRNEKKHSFRARVEIAIWVTNLRFFSAVDLTKYTTNFPDYEPDVFPKASSYQIDWDYFDWQLLSGLVFEI